MKRRKLIDLFCGAGGCTKGYQEAGFEVTGVDIAPQPHYVGDRFIQADVMVWLPAAIESGEIEQYDVIAASPPCQVYSQTRFLATSEHEDLVTDVRKLLVATGKPYIIENVVGAPLINPLMLCGSMFGLGVIRHRLFECRPAIWFPPAVCACKHGGATGNRMRRKGVTRTPSLLDGVRFVTVAGNNYLADEGRRAMGIDWMPKRYLSQAIPPAYTRFIGMKMMEYLEAVYEKS